jgi:hypothetical protein
MLFLQAAKNKLKLALKVKAIKKKKVEKGKIAEPKRPACAKQLSPEEVSLYTTVTVLKLCDV